MLVSVNMFSKLVLKSLISRDVSATGTGLNMLLSVIRFMFSYIGYSTREFQALRLIGLAVLGVVD